MVSNSTNINKTNSDLSLNTKRPRHMTLEIVVRAWNRQKHVAGLNQLWYFNPSL